MKFFLLGLLITSGVFAGSNDLSHRPKSFGTTKGKAVFVDFTEAVYHISYDGAAKTASIKAEIKINVVEGGFPVFDSVEAPTSIMLDGKEITATETSTPSNETTVRVLDTAVSTGAHTLVIEVPLKSLVEFKDGGVKSAFWTSDLSVRQFLERYMPANFEFDQVKMTFNVSFSGISTTQVIYTNGNIKNKTRNSFQITYPSHFTASSIFFHTVPQGATTELNFTLKSLDGRTIPVTLYEAKSILGGSGSLNRFKDEATKVFHELESDYGAWPHPQLIIYAAGMGGMEYCGATITEFRALGHEMFHSYFARGVMPANGNSGWLDEALASWRDSGYKRTQSMSGSSRMSAHPYYTRTTDRQAYSFGENFMRYLDGKVEDKGGLKPFMRYMVDKKVFSPLFVEEFIAEMEKFYGVELTADFKKYTYSSRVTAPMTLKSHEHSMHRKLTVKELQNLL